MEVAGTEACPTVMMKFVADVMLGRLVRLMRFSGYDVEYDRNAADEMLLRRSRYRMLLTKDRSLAERAQKYKVYLVKTSGGEHQLAEIKKEFPLRLECSATRCLVCNRKIRAIRKSRVEHLVPPFVFRKYDTFYFCRQCRRVYWQGTHFERMSRVIK